MLFKTGLLVVSNPKQIGNVLSTITKHVSNILYIQLLSALSEPFGAFYTNVFNSWPKYNQTVSGIYTQAARHCDELDVRVLLSGLKYKHMQQIRTQKTVEVIIFDKCFKQEDVDNFMKHRIANVTKECGVVTIDTGISEDLHSDHIAESKIYNHTVLGGTFDRLHIAHKLLLTEALLRTRIKITVGVTEENMLEGKTLWELVEPVEHRLSMVQQFLYDINPELVINVTKIEDPFGPTKEDPTMEMLVVSAETMKGGNKVNELRKQKGLPPLDLLCIELIDEPNPLPNEETKVSSSSSRMRLLGTLLKPVQPNPLIQNRPYVIGLTGGIASGKSEVAKRLQELGAEIINCDKVGHEIYESDKPVYKLIVDAFGKAVISENGEINRKVLGAIVFKDPSQRQKLNSLVWPAIAEEVNNRIRNCMADVVVIEAAVLISAGWEKYCHEVWTTIIPPSEALNRLQVRNGLNAEQAKARLDSQPRNKMYVAVANVVICSLWPVEYTHQQIDKAWNSLQSRLLL